MFLIGWRAIASVNIKERAIEDAKKSISDAFGLTNLKSQSSADSLLRQYRALLSTSAQERELQTFLSAHPEFLYPDHEIAISQPGLAGERKPDFAFSVRSSLGIKWIFVEIERPNKRIFTGGADFQFSSEFTQAENQILQWDALITREYAFFSTRFPGLFKQEYHLVFGRDAELDQARRDRLATKFSCGLIRTFSTFDDLAIRFETIAKRVFEATP